MKKILIIFSILFAGMLTCMALDYPRWRSMPINVYIPQQGHISYLMKQAFQAWENGSHSLVRFKYTPSQSNADIIVEFVDFVTNCSSGSAVGCTEYRTMKGHFIKSYITIGTKEYSREWSSSGNLKRTTVQRSDNHIYGVMLHEVGHAIGIDGHSDDTNSVMYSHDLNTLQYLTDTDLKLIEKKYR